MKTCKRCGVEYPLEDFRLYTDNRGYGPYRFHVCRDCERIKNKERNKVLFQKNPWPMKFSVLKSGAKKRGIPVDLTKEQFKEAFSRFDGCGYCQGPLPNSGAGIDRMDNAKGYTVDNIFPCCNDCNIVKAHLLTHEEMIEVAKLLKSIRAVKA